MVHRVLVVNPTIDSRGSSRACVGGHAKREASFGPAPAGDADPVSLARVHCYVTSSARPRGIQTSVVIAVQLDSAHRRAAVINDQERIVLTGIAQAEIGRPCEIGRPLVPDIRRCVALGTARELTTG